MNVKVSPLLGYNTNVRHKGKVYHIQTEDSGLGHPHIITHLFADGGRIVATRKTSYAEHARAPDYAVTVKKLMQDQHKAMFIALRDGLYDDEGGAIAPTPVAGLPLPTAASVAEMALDIVVDDAEPSAVDAAIATAATAPSTPSTRAAASTPSTPAAASTPPRDIPEIDVGVLERAAAERERESLVSPRASATPPFPLQRPASSGAGRYGTTSPTKAVTRTRRPSTGKVKRPSQPAPKSIFGDDLVSEKSLDEVILSYLSDDVDEK